MAGEKRAPAETAKTVTIADRSPISPALATPRSARHRRPPSEPGELAIASPTRYELIEEVGRGGLGRVDRCHDTAMGRDVAIKRLIRRGEDHERRFLREATITSRLQHPSIVPVYEAAVMPDGEPFYTMRLLEGRTLREAALATANTRERLALLPRVIAAADALGYAHSRGVVHRDIKPSNILLGPFGDTVVADWGLATTSEQRLHELGEVAGTPGFMPPEQERGDTADARADVYALGITLRCVLLGASVRHARRALPDDIPADLVAIVAKATHEDRAQRYPSALELADDLKRFETGQLVGAHAYSMGEITRRWLRRHRAAVVVGCTLFALLVLTGALSINRILVERQTAQRERARAIEARDDERARNNDLIVARADALLDSDPTAALAALRALPDDATSWSRARMLAIDARHRGVARHVLRGGGSGQSHVAFSPTGLLAASSAGLGYDIRIMDVESGEVRVLRGHTGTVAQLAFAPGGELVSGAWDGAVRIWNPQTGEHRTLDGHEKRVMSVAIAPDGSRVAAGGDSKKVLVWPFAGGEPVVLEGAEGWVRDVHFVGDHHLAAYGAFRQHAMIWDLRSGRGTRIDHPTSILSLVARPDGAGVITSTDGGHVREFDTDGALVRTLGPLATSVDGLAISHDGELIAAGDTNGHLTIWNRRGETVRSRPAHTSGIAEIAFTPDGSSVVTVSADRDVTVWSLQGALVHKLRGHSGAVLRMAFTQDSRWMATAAGAGEVRVWRLPAAAPSETGPLPGRPAVVAIAGNGAMLVGQSKHSAHLWLPARSQVIVPADGPVHRVAAAPSGAYFAFASNSGRIYLVSGDGTLLRDAAVHVVPADAAHQRGSPVAGLWVDDRGNVVSSDRAGAVKRWSPSGQVAVIAQHGPGRTLIAEGPRGQVVSAGADGRVLVWREGSGSSVVLELDKPIDRLAASRAGDVIAVAVAGEITVLREGRPHTLGAHPRPVVSMHFTPSGDRLISGGEAGKIWVWSMSGGEPTELVGHTATLRALVLSPDGSTAVSSDWSYGAWLWDIEAGIGRPLPGGRGVILDAAFAPGSESVVTVRSHNRSVERWPLAMPRAASDLRVHFDTLTSAVSGEGGLASPE